MEGAGCTLLEMEKAKRELERVKWARHLGEEEEEGVEELEYPTVVVSYQKQQACRIRYKV